MWPKPLHSCHENGVKVSYTPTEKDYSSNPFWKTVWNSLCWFSEKSVKDLLNTSSPGQLPALSLHPLCIQGPSDSRASFDSVLSQDHSRLFCHSWSWKILVVPMKMISPLVSYELIRHCLMGADCLFLLSHTHHHDCGSWLSVLQPLWSLCSTDHGKYKARSLWKPSPTEKVGIW